LLHASGFATVIDEAGGVAHLRLQSERVADDWPDAGPGWWLLDTAYRADNWLWTYFTVRDTPQWTPEANTLFLHRLRP